MESDIATSLVDLLRDLRRAQQQRDGYAEVAITAQVERDSYREIARAAIHMLADQHRRTEAQQRMIVALKDELRSERRRTAA